MDYLPIVIPCLIFSPWGFDFASLPVKNWSPSLGPLKLGRPGVLGRSGGHAEVRAGSSLAVSSGSCECAWSSLWQKDGHEGDRQGSTGEGIPNYPACSRPQTHEGTKPRLEEPPSWTCTVHVADRTPVTWRIMHWSRGTHAEITWLIIFCSRNWSCTHHMAIMHCSRGSSRNDHVGQQHLTFLILRRPTQAVQYYCSCNTQTWH